MADAVRRQMLMVFWEEEGCYTLNQIADELHRRRVVVDHLAVCRALHDWVGIYPWEGGEPFALGIFFQQSCALRLELSLRQAIGAVQEQNDDRDQHDGDEPHTQGPGQRGGSHIAGDFISRRVDADEDTEVLAVDERPGPLWILLGRPLAGPVPAAVEEFLDCCGISGNMRLQIIAA